MQGHIWRTGFEKNELKGVVFDDVPEALMKWHDLGIKVIILISICFPYKFQSPRMVFVWSRFSWWTIKAIISNFFDTVL